MMPLLKELRALFGFLDARPKSRGRSNPKAAIIVGSGPSAPTLPVDLLDGTILIAVNNAWRINRDFDYLVYPYDFPAERLPPESFSGRLVSNSGYMPAIDAAGGIIFCGATMAFAAGY